MQPTSRTASARRVSKYLVYASVIVGVALLIQLYSVVPSWLFYSFLGGWIVYLLVAIGAARGREIAYPAALVMSVMTLLVSLPQPEHFSLVTQGFTLASLTFILGTVIQLSTIISVLYYLMLRRKELSVRQSQA
jgi:hypothetical protein